MNKKLCIFCESFYFNEATPGYSEYTPGNDSYSIGCHKNYWEIEPYEDSRETYCQKLLIAKTCKDFKERKIKT